MSNHATYLEPSLMDYVAHGGYKALFNLHFSAGNTEKLDAVFGDALRRLPPDSVCIQCNAVGSTMIVQSPHAVIEGMAITALLSGAKECIIEVQEETQAKLVRHAIRQAEEKRLIAENSIEVCCAGSNAASAHTETPLALQPMLSGSAETFSAIPSLL